MTSYTGGGAFGHDGLGYAAMVRVSDVGAASLETAPVVQLGFVRLELSTPFTELFPPAFLRIPAIREVDLVARQDDVTSAALVDAPVAIPDVQDD